MSVRIHQLAKKIGMENKELLKLLISRGYEVKSVSSTIDNISAESLVEEFSAKVSEGSPSDSPEPVSKKTTAPAFPAGAIVKSAEDIKRERETTADKEVSPKVPVEPKSEAVKAPPAPKTPPSAPAVTKTSPAPAAPLAKKPSSPPAPPTRANAGTMPPQPSGPPKPPSASANANAPKSEETGGATTEDESAKTEKRIISAKTPIVVRDFASEIGLKPFKLISELMEMGIFASMNQTIEETVAQQIADRHGFTLEIHHRGETQGDKSTEKKKVEKVPDDDPRFLKPRPPIVCILGHVDHGKTTLLDAIRNADVTANEAGGITQHIGAYQIEHNERKITFLDTPGHAAFSKMRARGTNVTDIAVLVIAADDSFKPQTEEALRFAKEANNSIIVAINKIDSKGANVDRVKQEMQAKGIAPEDWGGETIAVEVSALKKTNINELLNMILLQSEILEIKANPDCSSSGTVIESQIEEGRGATASVIVERGTLKKGDALICGEAYCKVKSLMDENGRLLKEAGPATPVKIIGWSEVPASGEKFSTLKNEKAAKKFAAEVADKRKKEDNTTPTSKPSSKGARKVSVEDLFAAIARQKKKCLNLIVKSDVHGSTEALTNSLEEIKSDKVDIRIISKGVGHISKSDVDIASASEEDVTILGFNVRLDNGVQSQAKHNDVRIIQHEIIYELIDQVKECMAELLDPELKEKKLGVAEVRQVFGVGKNRKVAGCMVVEGTINRMRKARLVRGGKIIREGKIDTLKRFKDDVKEVRAGFECGINIDGYDDYREGDSIECIEVEKVRAVL